ncbi:MAG: carbon monoxide dehydrogenase [Rhodospirillaceae bacterium]|jgi:carbon-monoxide dehydrogenase medium subunit|nr:carbon monoxide dehydrogenase [Rhodospirillaceae bacterium]MBT3887127.1 carbon monoxide dehydrogenase [Rhodospirillaceae bacterium]MBT4116220.1 carbon monoxide dehydrogenase [Rhodospirillaceae bacterium]MBT4749476.1 carbon monoxide dehydrogenase [Rhodospirillaceae bacterium]MBT5179588.1 carbon monoxide dehydrogenase [Rhodospirillaceae bacterium]
MKPAPFEYHRARDVEDALAVLNSHDGLANILAGGQSLVPMLNLRVAPATLLVDISNIEELNGSGQESDAVTLGACVTHAEIEDGSVPDPSHGLMPRIARDISHRAVRNRGTIGGSLALADPSAEWIVTMLALDAVIRVRGASGSQNFPAADFFLGTYATALPEDAILTAVQIPQLTQAARTGFYKVCRKIGEFAASLAVAVIDGERGISRVALGGPSGAPMRLAGVEGLISSDTRAEADDASMIRAAVEADLSAAGRELGADALHLHGTTVLRALRDARGR